MHSFYIVAAIIVGILFPAYVMLDGGKVRQLLLADPNKKIRVFRDTSIHLIAITIVSLLPFWIDRQSSSVIGLDFLSKPLHLIGLFAISFMGLWLFDRMKLTPENAEKLQSQNAEVMLFMPTNIKEYRLMVFVSFVAGICEEIAYRGFLLWFLSSYMPIVPAIILANLPFALAHVTTTGFKNSIQAFVLALVFTAAYLLTRSLWLPILLHILMDLYSVTLTYKASRTQVSSLKSRL